MSTLSIPVQLGFTPADLTAFTPTKEIVRRLSDLRQHFSDTAKVERILAQEDPVIYRFWEIENHDAPRGLSFGVTCIYPGKIGREFYMTKGHFHSSPGDELYTTLGGFGKLALFSRDGDVKTHDMLPGQMSYIPTTYAHRTINTGNQEFVFLAIWPPTIEHDYDTILKFGFPQLVVEGARGPEVVDNPKHPKARS